jgi:hypothetical protein
MENVKGDLRTACSSWDLHLADRLKRPTTMMNTVIRQWRSTPERRRRNY